MSAPHPSALALHHAHELVATWTPQERQEFRRLVRREVSADVRAHLGAALRPDVKNFGHPSNWRDQDLPAAFAYLVPAFLPEAEVRTALAGATSRRRPTVPQLRRAFERLVLQVQRLEARVTELEARAFRDHGEED